MDNQKVIVGEASESDNEDEHLSLHRKTEASIEAGEATESDEETINFVNRTPMSETTSPSPSLSRSTLGAHDSLFMKKLRKS